MLPLEPITIVDQWKKKGHFLVLLRALLTWANISTQTSFTLFVYNTSSKIYCHLIMTLVHIIRK